LVNLIEKFLEDTEKMRVFTTVTTGDNGTSNYQEVYFFLGRDSALCISKQDNKVLYHIKYAQLQINITSPNEFTLNVGGKNIFFCQDESTLNGPVFVEKQETESASVSYTPDAIKYPYKAICDACTSKKCSQYDTINGRNFKFGKGKISEDMLSQYDKYCESKIKKFGCDKTIG